MRKRIIAVTCAESGHSWKKPLACVRPETQVSITATAPADAATQRAAMSVVIRDSCARNLSLCRCP
jgi:hypothetical protein